MKLYNSLTQKKEALQIKPNQRVNLFVCGITVYDDSHIGHARTYLFYDAFTKFIRKHLKSNIFYLQNVTDIDDKIINKSKELNKSPQEIAQEFEKSYLEDMDSLGIDSVDLYARATEHIEEIISQIEKLIEKKQVYKIDNYGYYFDISSFPDYGKLSRRKVEDAEDAVSRIDKDIGKKNRGDFVVWKLAKDDETGWQSPLGFGRPGWHIEDTAIAEKNFGYSYDIHGGAVELKFPHHEGEIALMESLSGIKPMVKTWAHTGLLTVDGKKMSKSLNNFIKIKDFIQKHKPAVLRMLVFSSHYRSPIDYRDDLVKEAQSRINRLVGFVRRLRNVDASASPFPHQEFTDSFWKDLGDDFNTPKAFASLFNLANEVNKCIDSHSLSQADAQKILGFMDEVNAIFSIIPEEDKLPEEIVNLIKERDKARETSYFEKSDKIRKELESKGYIVEDSKYGQRVYKK